MGESSGVNDGWGSSPSGLMPHGADDAPDESKVAQSTAPPAPLDACPHYVVTMGGACLDCGERVHVNLGTLNGPVAVTLTMNGEGHMTKRLSDDSALVDALTDFLHDECDMGGASELRTKMVLDFIEDYLSDAGGRVEP